MGFAFFQFRLFRVIEPVNGGQIPRNPAYSPDLRRLTGRAFRFKDPPVTTDQALINGEVNPGVAEIGRRHVPDDLLKSFHVIHGRSVKLHIADMPRIGEAVVGALQVNLVITADLLFDRDMETIRVVLFIGNSRGSHRILCGRSQQTVRKALRPGWPVKYSSDHTPRPSHRSAGAYD